ncbi:MAG: anion permease [Acidobacteria bacterium]|nr:anion permease [Acidobacteriota bacterium]
MTLEILLVLVLLAVVATLFALEWLSVDVVTLLLLVVLVISGVLTPEEAFSGFANDIIIILASVFVLSGAFVKTGVMDWLGTAINEWSGGSRAKVLLFVMTITAAVSAFMNNTTTTAIFMPAVFGLCKRSHLRASQLLIPLAFASMLGGSCTLIGTSTNVAASGFLHRSKLQPFSLFEFLPVGLTVVVAGTIYMSLLGYRLLPKMREASYTDDYQIREYLSEILIPEGSAVAGEVIEDTPLAKMDLAVLEIIRGDLRLYPEPDTPLREGDILIVEGTRDSLLRVKEVSGIEIKADVQLGDKDLITDTIKVAEAIVMPQSNLIDRTLKELSFRQRFGVSVLAIYRKGHALAAKLASLRLRVGDVLLLQGRAKQFESIAGNPDLWVLEEMVHVPFRRQKGVYAIVVLLMAVTAGGFKLLPLSIAFLLAALAAVLWKCITTEEAYGFVDWRLLILIGGMTTFGLAMEKTKAAEFVASWILHWTLPFGVYFILAGFFLMTVLLTQPMSNAAAVLVILPVALSTARQLDVNPRTFAVLVTLAASLSFITPFEPALLLVYGPGKYRFRDFVINGLPLTLIAFVIVMVIVPLWWPLR